MKKIYMIITSIIITIYADAYSAENRGDDISLTIPLLETPYNFSYGYRVPGMMQSLYITKAVSQVSNDSLGLFLYNRVGPSVTYLSIGVWDYIYTFLPLGTSWLHEEYHRAVLGNRGFNSYNDVYKFDFFTESIAVSHVKDDDLADLKENHPADFVRLAEAGIEGEFDLVRESRLDYFFSGRSPRFQLIGWWVSLLNSTFYIWACTKPLMDDFVDEDNESDGSNVKKRDSVGPDFTTWVYDLFRPDEPYASRGIHPSGVGVDRYIRYSDLSGKEKKYLDKQWRLSMLNYLSPHLININRFNMTDPFTDRKLYFNAALMYYMTSFGNTIDIHTMFKEGNMNLAAIYHTYSNHERLFPGLEVQVYRYPYEIFSHRVYITLKGMIWFQPKDQMFLESTGTPGGLAGAGVAVPVFESMDLFVYTEHKSEGWVSGNPALEAGYRFTLGVDVLW